MDAAAFDVDFDDWRMLAERDPVAFFAAREALVAAFIAAAPVRIRADLQALQGQIDLSRAQAGTPSRASVLLLCMMAERLAAMSAHLTHLRAHSQSLVECVADVPDV